MEVVDKQLLVFDDWDRKQRERLRRLVSDALIEEHKLQPLGQHSDALDRLLAYFRRQPVVGKELIIAVRPWEEYRIALMSGARGVPYELLDETFPTEEAAMHGIFLRRIRHLMEV